MTTGLRDRWQSGDRAYFEYHCWRDHRSADASLWYRSHQPVTVLGLDEPHEDNLDWPVDERLDAGMPLPWRVRFADGLIHTADDDELFTHPSYFDPDGGPPSLVEIALHEPDFLARVVCYNVGAAGEVATDRGA